MRTLTGQDSKSRPTSKGSICQTRLSLPQREASVLHALEESVKTRQYLKYSPLSKSQTQCDQRDKEEASSKTEEGNTERKGTVNQQTAACYFHRKVLGTVGKDKNEPNSTLCTVSQIF